MNLPRQSFISFTGQPSTHSNNNRNGTAHHTDFSTARLKSRLSVEINFIMCVGRGDETEYKLPGSSMLTGRGVEPWLPCAGGHFLSLSCQTGRLSELAGSHGITCGNRLRRSSPGSMCQPARAGVLTSTTTGCFLNTFFFPSRICSSRGQSL